MIIEILKTILIGIVEGITEWLPVSSTGHLILVEELIPFKGTSEGFFDMFDVVIQLGAIMAVVLLFWKRIWPFAFSKEERDGEKGVMSFIKKDIICAIVMLVVLVLINKILPFNQLTVIGAVATIATNMICGGAVFTLCAYKMGILNSLFGEEMINKVLKKLKFIKVKN